MTTGSLAGRSAVITGGGRGIGAAIARELCRQGAAVLVTARTGVDVEDVAEQLRIAGGRAWGAAADVTKESDVRHLGETARKHLGTVDILVHSAGSAASAPFAKISLTDWNQMLTANATSAFLCAREFLPGMLQRQWGRMINIASIAGVEGAKYVVHYSAAKHAVIGLTRSLALEIGGSGVTVNAICPGYVETPMTERTLQNIQHRAGMDRDAALVAVLATTGQSRLLRPEEVAERVAELCGSDAADINGEAMCLYPEEEVE